MKRTGIIVLLVLLILFGIPLILLNTSYFQQKVVDYVTTELATKTGARIVIEDSDLDPFRGVVFHHVQIEDSLRQPILIADRLDAGLRLLPLLRKRIELESLRIIRGDFRLNRRQPGGDLNIQQIINAFKTPKKKAILPWHINFSSIVLRNCKVRYDVLSKPFLTHKLDVNHLYFSGVSTIFSLKIAPKNHYQFKIKKFQAVEKSGLQIDRIRLQAKLFEEGLNLSHFELKSGASTIKIALMDAKYKNLKAFSHFADSVKFDPMTIQLNLVLSDFGMISPALLNLTKPVEVSIGVQGRLSDLTCNKMRLNIQNMILLDGRIALKGLPRLENLYVKGQIELFRILPEGLEYVSGALTNHFGKIPAIRNLGEVNYMGKINTLGKRWVVTGDISTDAGNLGTDLQLSKKDNRYVYEGKILTTDFQLNKLFPENKSLGKVSLDLSLKGIQDQQTGFSGSVDGKVGHFYFNGYDFKNLTMNGDFNKKEFQGRATMDDENAKLDFSGLVNISQDAPRFKFDLYARHVQLKTLKLTNKTGNSILSFNMHTDFNGRMLDDVFGRVSVDSMVVLNKKERFFLDHLNMEAGQTLGQKYIRITSPLINGDIRGEYEFKTLSQSLKKMLRVYFPSIVAPIVPDFRVNNNFTFNCSVQPSKSLVGVLGLPFEWKENLLVNGFYNDITGKFRLKVDVPNLNYGKIPMRSLGLLIENPQNEAKFLAFARVGTEEKEMKLNIDTRSSNDKTALKFNLSNSSAQTYSAEIQTFMQFSRRMDGQFLVAADFKESNILLNDTLWNIHPTNLRWENKKLYVEDFQLTHADQFIKLHGFVSANSSDTLDVQLNSFSLDGMFGLFPKTTKNLHLGGNVSGTAKCVRLLDNPAMNADLSVENFSYNHTLLGNLKAKSQWNNSMKAIALDAVIRSNKEVEGVYRKIATATGVYFPASDTMFLSIEANRVPIGFLEPYLGKILDKMDGLASGNVHLIGPVKKLGVYASAFVENATFGIKLLNTRYSFTDSVFVSPKKVQFTHVRVTDKEGNVGHATGLITHDYWKNVKTNIQIDAKNMLAMDLPAARDAYFYGKAYGSGTVSITGMNDKTEIDIKLKTEDKTKATISLQNNTALTEYNFIKFVQKKKVNEVFDQDLKAKKPIQTSLPTGMNLKVNLQIEATPNAEVTLITDPNSGDEIKARGNGAIRVVFSGLKDMELYGRYTIEEGRYKFVYENMFRRDFFIESGSSINFSGNPFQAELDIIANYTVNAKLSDLLTSEELSSLNLNRTSIPVNCVLKLDGELQKPGIQLDLGYPSADEDLKKQIANLINTDEMVNQQIVYLMLLGRFRTPSNSLSAQQSSTSNVTTALNTVSSTVSSQLNNMINDVFGKSRLSFDFDYRNAAYELGTPGEWKVGMSGQWLDNRVTFNGNLGSREDLNTTSKSQFIGEFDINIKIKNSAKWSARIFNKANDNQYFKSALNTQGIGLVYKEEFNQVNDLFKQMIESIKKPFQKKAKPVETN